MNAVEIIKALTALVHELAPWAALLTLVVGTIGAWQSKRANDHSKKAAETGVHNTQAIAENTQVTKVAAAEARIASEKVDQMQSNIR